MILGRVSDELDFEARVFATYVESGNDAEFGTALSAFGDELAVARREYLASRTATDALVGELS
jgi:hypothetical protein